MVLSISTEKRIIILFLLLFIQIYHAYSMTLRNVEAPRSLTKKSCRFDGDGCKCIVRLRGECCCKGHTVTQLPANLTTSIRVLIMFNTSITDIPSDFFGGYHNLEEIEITNFPLLKYMDGRAVQNLTHLRKFFLTWCKQLEEISGTLMEENNKIQSLILRDNGLLRMPSLAMTDSHKLEVEIDLSGNEIKYIGDGRVNSVRARSLRLNHNHIKEIAGYAFQGSSFVKLYLDHNMELQDLSVDAFKGISELHHLDLSDTSIVHLPINGLKNLKSLTLRNVETLKRLPSVLSFTQLETAHFTYPHHCCLFKYVDDVKEGENGLYKNNMREIHHRMCKEKEETTRRLRRKAKRQLHVSPAPPDIFAIFDANWIDNVLDGITSDDDDDLPEFPPDMIGASKCLSEAIDTSVKDFYKDITCTPKPDDMNPCENIVGYPLLRKAIWVVWILAIVGNVVVWITLGLAFEKRMRVHYMFMINLSIADLLIGVFLGILAIEDVRTADEYYRHAVAWQTGWGCQTAGFLAVFASELSIISMFLIAFEMAYNTRMGFYGKRLQMKQAVPILVCGWIFALVTASLPFFGISSYSSTSICLPLRAESTFDKVFIIGGLFFNFTAFLGMAVGYAVIIRMLKNPDTPSREEDTAIITKMAILIGTDLLCWFPTLFFGITAAMGTPLISISNAKIFLVFFFPINAFSNPFLYVFFTEVIQRKVKTKTLPIMKRITSSPGVALNTLSNFYNSQPPRRSEDISSPTRLQVTQMTSLNSTPRGSNCSTNRTIDSYDNDMVHSPKRNGSSPRVSFQDEVIFRSGQRFSSDATRRSLQKRISAIPEVSDLSEHSSENSHHEHIPRNSEDRVSRFNFNRLLGRNRHESAKSTGQDSGRGSLASTGTRDTERVSLVSGTTDSDGDSRQSVQMTKIILPAAKPIRKISPIPRRLIDRRQSAPFITVTECSDNSM